MVLGKLNQAGALSQTGLHLAGAESFFIGNPVVGKKAFKMDAAVGAELPMRLYVWVNGQGTTEIGYFTPSDLLTAVNAKLAAMGSMMNKKMAAIASGAGQ